MSDQFDTPYAFEYLKWQKVVFLPPGLDRCPGNRPAPGDWHGHVIAVDSKKNLVRVQLSRTGRKLWARPRDLRTENPLSSSGLLLGVLALAAVGGLAYYLTRPKENPEHVIGAGGQSPPPNKTPGIAIAPQTASY